MEKDLNAEAFPLISFRKLCDRSLGKVGKLFNAAYYQGFICVFLFVVFPGIGNAEMGDNCETDLTSSVPETIDWAGVHSLRADDGSIWQRGIVSFSEDELFLAEGGVVSIPALAASGAMTQFFLFSPQQNAANGIQKPAAGTCFEGKKSDASGNTEIKIAVPFLWNALGNEVMIDVFYRMKSDSEFAREMPDALTIGIGTQNKIRRFQVKVNPSEEQSVERQGQVIHRSGQLYGYSPRTADERLNRTNDINVFDEEPFSKCNTLCGGKMTLALKLDPAMLQKDFKGASLGTIADREIIIGRLPGPHTYYAAANDGSTPLPNEILKKITRQALTMEAIKRALLGYENYNGKAPGLEVINAQSLKAAVYDMGLFSEHTVVLAQQIALLMTKPEERDKAARGIDILLLENHLELQTDPFLDWNIAESLQDIIPTKPSSMETWADDFIHLLNFWTGNRDENLCLMLNDDEFTQNLRAISFKSSQCDMEYVTGSTPKLVLNMQRRVDLSPDFKKAQLTTANMKFSSGTESIAFEAGDKQILDYRYLFSEPFTKEMAGSVCIKQTGLRQLVDFVTKKYALNQQESQALFDELDFAVPKTTAFTKLTLAHPKDIAELISWKENGRKLSLLQLFFKVDPNGCDIVQLNLPPIELPLHREGFEAGILPE